MTPRARPSRAEVRMDVADLARARLPDVVVLDIGGDGFGRAASFDRPLVFPARNPIIIV